MKRAILIILIVTFQLFILPMIWIIGDSKADEVSEMTASVESNPCSECLELCGIK